MPDPATHAAEDAAGVNDYECPLCGGSKRRHCACEGCGYDDDWARADEQWDQWKDES